MSDVRRRLDRRIPLSVPVFANAGSGPGDADHCGPLVGPGRDSDVAAWLTDMPRSRALVLQNIAGPHGAFIPRAARPTIGRRHVRAVPIEDLDPQFIPSASFRRQLRRYERALADAGVTFEWVEAGGSRLSMSMRCSGCTSVAAPQQAPESSLDERHRVLLLRLTACRRGADPLRSSPVRERIVAVLVGFRWKDSFAAYQSGWHSDYAADSLGSVSCTNRFGSRLHTA